MSEALIKILVSEIGKIVLVLAAIAIFCRVLELAYAIPDKTLFTSLAAVAGTGFGTVIGYWFGSSRTKEKSAEALKNGEQNQ